MVVVVTAKSNVGMGVVVSNGVPQETDTPPMAREDRATSPTESEPAAMPLPANRALYLIGRPTLKGFIRHVRNNAVRSQREGDLVDEWNAANAVVSAMQKSE